MRSAAWSSALSPDERRTTMSSRRPSAAMMTSSVGRPAADCRASRSDNSRCRCARRVAANRPNTRQGQIGACSASRSACARRRCRSAARRAARAPSPSSAEPLAELASLRVAAYGAGSSVGCGSAETTSALSPRLTSCSALGVSSRGVPSVVSAPSGSPACVTGWSADKVLVGRRPRAAWPAPRWSRLARKSAVSAASSSRSVSRTSVTFSDGKAPSSPRGTAVKVTPRMTTP